MFEMFVTVLAAAIAAIYGVSKSVFMNGPYQHYYRIGLIVFIILFIIIYNIRIRIRDKNINSLHVDLEDYLYYDHFTTPIYRIGYFISYLVQNLLFDYTYMKRNFNFCKGLDVYEGGVTDYYIKFRNTWYRYLQLTMLRHKVSVKKLQSFAAAMKNEMIYKGFQTDEEKDRTLEFEKNLKEYYKEHNTMTKEVMKKDPLYQQINKYYRKHLWVHYKAAMYIEKKEPLIEKWVKLQDFRSKRDVNDYKKMRMKE